VILIKIDGLWNLIKNKDGSVDSVKWDFHKRMKDKFRDMIDIDPDAKGDALHILDNADFDRRIAVREEGEQPVLGELFIEAMLQDYERAFEHYHPGILERKYKQKVLDFLVAAYRNDSAYFERFGGMISWLVINKDKFPSIHGDYLFVIEELREYWKENDGRVRTVPWIDWGFKYIIRQYKRSKKNGFYHCSVNHVLQFIYLNADKWTHHEVFYPENWFGNGRGKQVMELYGGYF
jgi:hypothetical protein